MKEWNRISADEAARLIKHGEVVGIGGFSSVGTPKAVPRALAKYAKELHAAGIAFQVGLISGGAAGTAIDGALADAEAVYMRTPFQSDKCMRKAINRGKVAYYDLHLSHMAQDICYGFVPKVDVVIVEASRLEADGSITLSTSVGVAPTLLEVAERVIVEVNGIHYDRLRGMHDIYLPEKPPFRKEIPVYRVNDRIGSATVKVDPKKIVAVVETEEHDSIAPFMPMNETTKRIGELAAEFLAGEWRKGNIPKEFLPVQSGVGNVANAVLGALGDRKELPPFSMFTEVIQDSVIDLMEKDRIAFATGSSLTLSEERLKRMYDNMDLFRPRILLRPQEVTNHPEVVRRLGVIAINTALEADIFGNVNSTHVMGSLLMNGIGGSADFARNAFLSIFTTPSTAKGGLISAIVPQVSHVDSTEHDVRVLITEQGVADLRGKSPRERAECIIKECTHPDYRELLWEYVRLSEGKGVHTPFSLENAMKMHLAFERTGDMRNAVFDK